MKGFTYLLMITIVAFLMGATSNPFGAKGILQAVNRIRGKPTRDLPPAGSTASRAPAVAADGIAVSDHDLSGGNVEEYAAEPDDVTNRGAGYGDVFDSNGHFLWRFAVLERGNSEWKILRYFSDRESERRDFEAAPEPAFDRNPKSSFAAVVAP